MSRIATLAVCLVLISGASASAQKSEEKAKKVDWRDILETYKKNEAKGDTEYTGKKLQTTFTLHSVEKVQGGYELTFNKVIGYSVIVGRFAIKSDQVKKAAKLEAGAKITIIGICEGKIGSAMFEDHTYAVVRFKDCEIKD